MTISYKITPASAGAHYFDIALTFVALDNEAPLLRLPSWIPGSYLVRDFARNIVEISAHDELGPLVLTKLDKDSWALSTSTGVISVNYRVYANDLSVRTAFLDDQRGFFNATSTFLAVVGQENQPCKVDIRPPSFASTWRVATSLPRDGASLWGFGEYAAVNYHELIDHPVEMADFTVVSFEACGVPHHMVVSGCDDFDTDQMSTDLVSVCENHSLRFGKKPPFQEYWFLTAIVPGGFGGLEHMDSTALIAAPEGMPGANQPRSKEYKQFLELCSHEYFHCWNVKRIQPAAFQPFDLSKENFTTLLWAFEGITSYYDQFGVLQSGCIDLNDWLRLIGENLSRVRRGSGRTRQTLRESSFDAWTKFYKQDENAENAVVSYYAKGGLLILGLEMSLRLASDGKVTMDDVMRLLWERHGITRLGVPEDGIEVAVKGLLEANNVDPRACLDLLKLGLDTRDELPLSESFKQFGLQLNWRARSSLLDKGGNDNSGTAVAVLSDHGITLATADSAGLVVKRIRDVGSAAACGISAGDILLAIDGRKATAASLDKLRTIAPGEVVQLHVFRRERLLAYQLTLQASEMDTAWLALDADASAAAVERRTQWLGG
ncbi:MAG: putative metalloprotease with PDZ domain [Gammaproteobacteria bacterium]|jgi:predicted metalloprotease with PDZ domain